MKRSTLDRNGVTPEMVKLISRLIALIPWPARRQSMGDVTLTILEGKPRVAEKEFGWSRSSVALGINEYRSGITCVNDLSQRHKLKTEEKNPKLLNAIQKIVESLSQAESQSQAKLLSTNITAQSVYDALVKEGWPSESLPTVRTISNIMNRHSYRLQPVAKTKVKNSSRHRHRLPKRPSHNNTRDI